MRASRAVLDGVAGRLRPLLDPLGFEFTRGDEAVSSGGPFATCSLLAGAVPHRPDRPHRAEAAGFQQLHLRQARSR